MEIENIDVDKLAKQSIKGNVKAYGELIEMYKDYLYKIAFSYTRDENIALDVVRDCVINGFENIKKLRQPEFFKTWITKILINAAKDVLKKSEKYILSDAVEALEPLESSPIEEKLDLYQAIDFLPDNYRSVIVLKYFSDLKISQISYIMGIPEGSVKSYLNRARQELKNYLKEDYIYEG
ncbi:sigma-70 family RNA polymerase sigma factor [Acetivibrio cellulolyticus]|uniref:sigma-70 family RNA polymerase sigma factor n=1 Tax=Acetivibrio cellulolyticus TaxID=35830 RepID=UPI001F15E8CE|nr:sigma-70 family RNA polymerase sigma factor [Acetivibrio cellulolyticus]